MHSRAEELRQLLSLQPHPEGGWYREVFRSNHSVQPDDGRGPRAALTVIYFLLAEGESSAWHVVQSDECWHFCEGAPLDLMLFNPATEERQQLKLGPIDSNTQALQIVPAGLWQAARSQGAYTLVQCTVAPGFDFADFSLLRNTPNGEDAAASLGEWAMWI